MADRIRFTLNDRPVEISALSPMTTVLDCRGHDGREDRHGRQRDRRHPSPPADMNDDAVREKAEAFAGRVNERPERRLAAWYVVRT